MADRHKLIETKRLFLRPTLEEDDKFIYQLMNTDKWKLFIGDREIHSVSDAREYIISRMHPQLKALGFANNTLIRKTDNVKIGTCGLYKRDGIDGLDIGYALLPEFEGFGFAREAVSAALSFGFDDLGYEKISAYILPSNQASITLVEHFNFQLNGLRKLSNDDEDLNYYILSKEEWHKTCLPSGN